MGATSGIGYEVARIDDSTVNLDKNESEMKEVGHTADKSACMPECCKQMQAHGRPEGRQFYIGIQVGHSIWQG